MMQTSLMLMKSLNKTKTPIFQSVVCSLFPKAIFFSLLQRMHVVCQNLATRGKSTADAMKN